LKICGIDASTTCTGISLFEDGLLTKHEIFNMKNNKDSHGRLLNMMCKIGDFIQTNHPDSVIIEDSWSNKNVETTKTLSNLIGSVMYVCAVENINISKMKPSEWRKIIGFQQGSRKKRNELKLEAINYVNSTFNLTCGDDEAEAICIGKAGVLSINSPSLFE